MAQAQREEGETDLASFVLNNTAKKVNELIQTTWEMKGASAEIERLNKTRVELMQLYLTKDCIQGCEGQWLQCAKETLLNNQISVKEFSSAVNELLEKERGSYRNILIVGPANCGKTFLSSPLCEIFKCFVNPASNSFAWVGAETAEIILLNDFRWSEKVIPWHDFLQFLEGQTIHVPAPKTYFAEDLILDKDTPIFATSIGRIRKTTHGVVNEIETEMMEVRWKTFSFRHQLRENEIKDLKPCGTCFAKLIYGN